jgi:integrase/recombinase XerD
MPPVRLPNFLERDQFSALIEAAKTPRDALMIQLGLFAGLRVSEIVHVRIENINLVGRRLKLEITKGSKDAYLPIAQVLIEPLRAQIGDRTQGWLFPSPRAGGKPLSTRQVQYLIPAAGVRAGLVKRVKTHTNRHSFATALLNSGATIEEVRELCRHADISTTARYLHCLPDRLLGTVDRLGPAAAVTAVVPPGIAVG